MSNTVYSKSQQTVVDRVLSSSSSSFSLEIVPMTNVCDKKVRDTTNKFTQRRKELASRILEVVNCQKRVSSTNKLSSLSETHLYLWEK